MTKNHQKVHSWGRNRCFCRVGRMDRPEGIFFDIHQLAFDTALMAIHT
jgi:hypothetical protein